MGKAARKTEPISAKAEKASKTMAENKAAKTTKAKSAKAKSAKAKSAAPKKRRVDKSSPRYLKKAFPVAFENIAKWSRETNPAKFLSKTRLSKIFRQKLRKIQQLHGDDTKMMVSEKFLLHLHMLIINVTSDVADVAMLFARHAPRPTLMEKDVHAALRSRRDTSIDTSITVGPSLEETAVGSS